MKTEWGFIIWTAMLLHFSVIKGQTSDAPPDLRSNSNPTEVIPNVHVTSKIIILESRPSSAYRSSSLPPSPNPEITTTIPPPSQSTRDPTEHSKISTSQTPALQNVTTLIMETASVPAATNGSSTPRSPEQSTISESAVTAAPASSINPSERPQTYSLTSSVVQKTQTTVSVTPSYPTASQFALTGSSKVTGPAPLEDNDEPSELDVGDEESGKVSHRQPSPLDPLLAALVSIFIICTAMVSAVLFLRFRQRSEHPEFHRLQDLPMDDLLEDTPLSRYSY
ncbi:uncharacterized protein [Paramisgurnus dabryanus]|uniref:uncharacterized protein isoform X1 n=1 Tax=Paramisgurnus dabryanus TaxID=90735 RepID=UPI0031F3A17B